MEYIKGKGENNSEYLLALKNTFSLPPFFKMTTLLAENFGQ